MPVFSLSALLFSAVLYPEALRSALSDSALLYSAAPFSAALSAFPVPEFLFPPDPGITCLSAASATVLVHVLSACVCDLRCGKIPNSLILSGILCGTAFRLNECFFLIRAGRSALSVWSAMAQGAAGFLFPFLLLSLPALLKMIGAGDVKLLAVTGLFAGPKGSFLIVLYSIFAGGVISVYLVRKRKNLFERLSYFWFYLGRASQSREPLPYRTGGEESGEFAFSVPILAGVLAYAFRQLAG